MNPSASSEPAPDAENTTVTSTVPPAEGKVPPATLRDTFSVIACATPANTTPNTYTTTMIAIAIEYAALAAVVE